MGTVDDTYYLDISHVSAVILGAVTSALPVTGLRTVSQVFKTLVCPFPDLPAISSLNKLHGTRETEMSRISP